MSNSTVGVGADDLVTGEAVALELPAAGIGIRALSGFLDLLVAGAALWIGLLVSSAMTENADEAIIRVTMTLLVVLVTVVLPTTLETLTRGRSVGKLATGLRTVRDDAGPIGFRHALTRALVGFVEIWALVGVPALVSAIVSNKGKRLGDYAAASDDASPAGCLGCRRRYRPTARRPGHGGPPVPHARAIVEPAVTRDPRCAAARRGGRLCVSPAPLRCPSRGRARRGHRRSTPTRRHQAAAGRRPATSPHPCGPDRLPAVGREG